MTLQERLSIIPSGMWLMLENPPRIHSLMSGIVRAGLRSDGLLRAVYEDGEERELPASRAFLERETDAFTLLDVASELTA